MWLDGIKKLLKKEEPEPEEEVYACPNCGSTNLGYYTGLINFIQVINDIDKPRYGQSAKCLSCGYRTKVYEEGCKGRVEDELRKVQ